MDHPAVAVLHQVPGLTVDPAGRDAVSAEEVRVHRCGLAVAPRRRQVHQLRRMKATLQNHLEQAIPSCVLLMHLFDLVFPVYKVINALALSLRRHCTFIKHGPENELRSCSVMCIVEVTA